MTCSFARIVKILFFYTIFYTLLAAYSALLFTIFLKTLKDEEPKWQLGESLIGDTPVLDFRPKSSVNNIIRYKANDVVHIDHVVNQLDEFLSSYQPSRNKSTNVQNCYLKSDPEENRVCDFKLSSDLSPCLPQYSYGYPSETEGPCVFLKLNKVFGWTPTFYHRDNVPPEMPQDLVEKIKDAELKNEQYKVWVDCVPFGSTDPDTMGPISYYPQQGFDGKYFPFRNIEGYLSPLVAVHFQQPKRGVLIAVECRAWAENIDVKNIKRSVRFGLFIE